MTRLLALLAAVLACEASGLAEHFQADFSSADLQSWTAAEGVAWRVEDGVLVSPNSGGVRGMLFAPLAAQDISLRVDVKLPRSGRRNVALAFRFGDDGTGWLVRWYDQRSWLELIRYEKGTVVRIDGNHWQASSPPGSAPQRPDQWYTMALQVVGATVRAKVWLRGEAEPGWQLEAECADLSAGRIGVSIDQTVAQFDNFGCLTGLDLADIVREERRRLANVRHRRRSVVLRESPVGNYMRWRADFWLIDGVREPSPEVVFRARDESNYYYCRTTPDGLTLGKVVADVECTLATSHHDWYKGPGRYRMELAVRPARRDDRGTAWFINDHHVPPMVEIRARIRRTDDLRAHPWVVCARDDPIRPGKQGEPYWYTDPFATSSAQEPLGSRVGWRETPGVTWLALEVDEIGAREPRCPVVEPVQVIHTGERGGCWLALGDLDGDARLDYVVARNQSQAVTALTAYGNDGRELWRWGGGPGPSITYDVPTTVYDLDLDGAAEVLCSIEGFLLVLDGATGQEERRWPLPEGLKVADCIIIANLRGLPQAADLLIKTRYDHVWAFTNEWRPLWEFHGNTGHHPAVRDIDEDGRDEVLCGFTLIDDDGTVLWQKELPGHADTARLTEMRPGGPIRALSTCCGGNDMALTALGGDLLCRQRPGMTDFHFQSAWVGEVRPDVPGYEIMVDDGHAAPARARVAMLDHRGRWLGAFYVSYPRFHKLMDWDGDGVMEIVIPSDHLLCDGRGRPVVRLADAPELSARGAETPIPRIADVCGDGRDELVLFNADSILVYGNPRPARRPFPAQPVVQERYYNFTYY
jgi:hypothetical protein